MKTTITFRAIDTLSKTSCPLYLSEDSYYFNEVNSARHAGKYYKAVWEDRNTVVLYSRNQLFYNAVMHRYVIAMDWNRSDDRLKKCAHTPETMRVVERILHQRLLYMIKVINTSNI